MEVIEKYIDVYKPITEQTKRRMYIFKNETRRYQVEQFIVDDRQK